MSSTSFFSTLYGNAKDSFTKLYESITFDINSFTTFDITKLPLTRMLMQLVIAIVAFGTTIVEILTYFSTASFKQIFSF